MIKTLIYRLKTDPFLILILLFWSIGLFLRCYRQDQLLGFYYDQGRDALMARDILTFRNLPAIGPTTGIQGLHLGPFWYYLIVPGYFFGRGSPVIASWFIAFLESLSIPLICFLLRRYFNQTSAILASFFWTFSYYLIRSSRWFSNPTPIPFFALLIIFCLLQIYQEKKPKYWYWLSLLLSLSLQLEAASAVFFIPTILIFSLIHKKTTFSVSPIVWFKSALLFSLPFLPVLAFEIKNRFLISHNLFNFILGKTNTTSGRSWGFPNLDFIFRRLGVYFEVFFSKLDTNTTAVSYLFLAIILIGTILLFLYYRHNLLVQITLLWLFVPLIFLLFFQGNYGQLYDYYLTGFFPAFFLLFAISLSLIRPSSLRWLTSLIIVAIFLFQNLPFTRNYLSANPDGPKHISLGNQILALQDICHQTQGQPYNLDIYIPPIEPYPYDYLLGWLSSQHLCHPPQTTPQPLVFTLQEIDTVTPHRLAQWLQNWQTLAKIDSEKSFGGIIVTRRTRL